MSSPPDPAQDPNPLPDIPSILDTYTQAWKRSIKYAVPQDELAPLIETIFSNDKTIDMVEGLQGKDVQAFIDVVDTALGNLDLAPRIRGECVRALRKMCARHTLVPTSLKIELCDDQPGVRLYSGGYGDVWKRSYQGREVAVKVLRTYATSDLRKMTRRFCKEFVPWKSLQHPNLLPLLGVVMTEDMFAMVSDWMPNGNITDFVAAKKDVNRFELLVDVATGLIYMHDQGMVHGDLKGANILVDETHHARLADFGLIATVSDTTTLDSHTQGGTTRWMSPELLDSEIPHHRRTKCSDCYALGMVIYEVLSGRIPFHEYASHAAAIKVTRGHRPARPQGGRGKWFTDDVWKALKRCWMPHAGDRPKIEDVLQCLENVSRSWKPPPAEVLQTTDSPTSNTSGQSDEKSMDLDRGVGSPSLQPLDDMDVDGNEASSPSQPSNELPSKCYTDDKNTYHSIPSSPPPGGANDVWIQYPSKGMRAASPGGRYEEKRVQHIRRQTQTTQADMSSSVATRDPTRLFMVPQTWYKHALRQEWKRREPIEFGVIKLTDAATKTWVGIHGHDDKVFDYDGVGTSIICRIHCSGRDIGKSKILTTNHKIHRESITKKKLAFEVAKLVKRYIKDIQNEHGCADVTFENLVLVRLFHVSKASWQPELWYEAPAPLVGPS